MRKVLAGMTAVGLMAGGSLAATSSFWTVTTQEGFAAGELTNVSVNSGGRVDLAPPLQQLADTEELYVWSMVSDAAGNIFVGTGNNGRLFRMSPDGGLSLLADLEEPDVLCLLMRPDGEGLYAGTSGGGTIYEIDLSGSVTSFHDTGERYVWDLAFDDDGSVLVATGDDGRIYRIDGQGKTTLFFDSPETHIMYLKPGGDGIVYAGGEGKGLVYKLSPGGDPFVLHEVAEPEVCCLLLDTDGVLYAAGISVPGTGLRGSPVPVGPVPEPTPPVNATHGMQVMDEPQNGTPPASPPGVMLQMVPPGAPGGSGGGSSTIYRIDPDGVVTPIWRSSNDVVHALHLDADGMLIASTGQRGRLYRINPAEQTWAVMAEVSASQLTTIVDMGDGEMLLGAANMGTLFRVGSGHEQDGRLESTVYDASTWSRWGRLAWRAKTPSGTSIEFQTRSGNSSDPDSSWSPWTPLDNMDDDRDNDGDDNGGQAASPNARFVQWRAELSSSQQAHTPLLQRVSLAYMQQNLKPKVHYVAVLPRSSSRNNGRPPEAGKAGGGQPDSSPATGPPPGPTDNPVRGPWVVKWQASDGNADRLQFDLYFRSFDEEEDSWTLLAQDLSSESHRWDTASFPDGFYELKVVASDERSNPPEVALWAYKTSEPVLVDNTPPEIRGLKLKSGDDGTVHVSGVAQDGTGPLTEGHYRVDAGDWVPMSAADGIFDSAKESFAFEVSLGEGSGHALVVRVTDMAGNVALERVLR